MISVGEKAPIFEGISDSGEKIVLSDFIGKKNVVLYFYPKDETPGCTAEACGFRDNWEKIVSMDATILGVSSQSVDSHKKFKQRHELPFTLIADAKNDIRKKYGATGMLIPPRVTFIVDKEGVVRYVLSSQLDVTRHVRESLEVLEKLQRNGLEDAKKN